MSKFPSKDQVLFHKSTTNATYKEVYKALKKLKREPLHNCELLDMIYKIRGDELKKRFNRPHGLFYDEHHIYRIIEENGYIYAVTE
jgi:hypothetical protein